MEEVPYNYEQSITEIHYDFVSKSQDKNVAKRVSFTTSDYQNIYNLALLDVLESGEVSDISESRNRDMKTILATVIRITEEFLNKNQQSIVIFKGSDERRQRLYRLVISRDITEIQKKFIVFGTLLNQKPEKFKPNRPYVYFIITKKSQ